jgi:hypothetical protein
LFFPSTDAADHEPGSDGGILCPPNHKNQAAAAPEVKLNFNGEVLA